MVDYDRDVDHAAIGKLIALTFSIDVLSNLLGPRPIVVHEPRLVSEGGQLVPADRVYLARLIRAEFGPAVAGCVMDNHYIFRLH
jgi:hypothetical protein